MSRLAKRGTTFLNAHCQAPLCNPSRTSLLLGLRPTSTGIYGLAPYFRAVAQVQDRVPLIQHFKQEGYQTFTVGKIWHDGYPLARDRSREFTEWGVPAAELRRPASPFTTTPGGHPAMDWGPFPERDQDHGDYHLASWAIEKLKSRPQEPFFLSVGFRLPHVPCYAPTRWFDLYPDREVRLPAVKDGDRDDTPEFSWYLHWKLPEPRLSWLASANQWRPLVRAYLASISFVDAQVGRVLDALKESGQERNTIVVLWSDHGWHLGEKGISGKNSLWERSTRVPLILAGPGIARNARCSRPAELLDLYPTLVEQCGLPKPEGLEGHSLVPQLKNARAPRAWPAITSHNQGNHAVRSERYRYIRYADGSEELYDMKVDPNEWTNLAGNSRHSRTVREHRRWLPRVDLPPAPGSASRVLTYDPVTRKAVWEGKVIVPEEKEN